MEINTCNLQFMVFCESSHGTLNQIISFKKYTIIIKTNDRYLLKIVSDLSLEEENTVSMSLIKLRLLHVIYFSYEVKIEAFYCLSLTMNNIPLNSIE